VSDIPHIPVLYREVIQAFEGIDEGIIIDCTMGYAGHSSMLLDAYPNITLIGIDQDQTAIDFSSRRLAPYGARAKIKKGRFSEVIKTIIEEEGAQNIRGILADIGVSSLQLDQKDRGFSYESETLDMRMNQEATLSAAEVVNGAGETLSIGPDGTGGWWICHLVHDENGPGLWDEVIHLAHAGARGLRYRRYWRDDPERGHVQTRAVLIGIDDQRED